MSQISFLILVANISFLIFYTKNTLAIIPPNIFTLGLHITCLHLKNQSPCFTSSYPNNYYPPSRTQPDLKREAPSIVFEVIIVMILDEANGRLDIPFPTITSPAPSADRQGE